MLGLRVVGSEAAEMAHEGWRPFQLAWSGKPLRPGLPPAGAETRDGSPKWLPPLVLEHPRPRPPTHRGSVESTPGAGVDLLSVDDVNAYRDFLVKTRRNDSLGLHLTLLGGMVDAHQIADPLDRPFLIGQDQNSKEVGHGITERGDLPCGAPGLQQA